MSTISDEIKKNSTNGQYDPRKAHHKSYVRRHEASFRGKNIAANPSLREFVESNLIDGQSPEAISGRLKHYERDLIYVSKDTIYRYLRSPYGYIIGLVLRKKKRSRKRVKVTKLIDRMFIDKRLKIIEERGRIGDLEADFIVSGKSGKGVLLTATDRKSRISFLEIIYEVTIDNVHEAFSRIKKRFPEVRTLTIDNDILFQMHKTLATLLDVRIYFCHPYHSWEKGSIENVNRYIRKFIPKGSNLSHYDKELISEIEDKCNGRFMKCLTYATPQEKLDEYRRKKKTKNSNQVL